MLFEAEDSNLGYLTARARDFSRRRCDEIFVDPSVIWKLFRARGKPVNAVLDLVLRAPALVIEKSFAGTAKGCARAWRKHRRLDTELAIPFRSSSPNACGRGDVARQFYRIDRPTTRNGSSLRGTRRSGRISHAGTFWNGEVVP